MLFSDAAYGQRVRIERTVGRKIAPVNTPELEAFYNPDGAKPFGGYNFEYEYYDGERMRAGGLMRLDDDSHVWTY